MAILSYLAQIPEGQQQPVSERVNAIEGCEAIPADNADLMIVVAESPSDEGDKALHDELTQVPGILGLTLTFGRSLAPSA